MQPDSEGTFVFVGEDALPLVLGDNRGSIDDIPAQLRGTATSTSRSWAFELASVPSSATVQIALHSIAKPSLGCFSLLRINGTEFANLSSHPETVPPVAGADHLLIDSALAVDPTMLRPGVNRIELAEEQCVGDYPRPVWNDSYTERLVLRTS